MTDNFENLGFQVSIDGADSAVSHLDKIIKRLNTFEETSYSVKKAEISLANAQLSLANSQKSYENAQNSAKKAEIARKNAAIDVQNAQIRLNAIMENTKATETHILLAEHNLLQAKNSLSSALLSEVNQQNAVEKARNQLEKSTNAVVTAELNLQNAVEKEKEKQDKAKKSIDKKIDSQKKEEKQVKKNTDALTKYITKQVSIVALSRKLARFVSGAIKESANYTENLVLFQTAFGSSSKQQLDWALGIADAYGLARNEVVKFAGTFRQLSSSLGIVDKTADIASETVTKLGYDLSALFNTSVEDAMDALQTSIFAGQSKPLRRYGIDITQTQIDALFETNEALAGLGVNARNLTQADKAIVRLIITLKSGKNAFGTMSEEINNLQSQIRIFQGSLSNFKLAIGNLVNEPLGTAIAYINGFIIAMTNIVNAFAPKKEETVIDNVTLGAEEASEAIDELNRKLADFDKFNVLGGQSNGGSSSLAVTEALNRLLEEQVALYDTEYETALSNMNNAAISASKNIIGWFVKVDENGEIVFEDGMPVWTESAKLLGASLLAVGGIISGKVLVSVANFVGSLFTLKNAISIAETALIGGIIYSFVRAVEAFRDGEYWVGALAVAIGVTLAGALIAIEVAKHRATNAQKQYTKALIEHTAALTANTQALQKNSTKMQAANIEMKKTTASITAMEKATAAMSVAFAVGGLATLWSSEGSSAQKLTNTFIGLAAGITAAAVAIAAFKQNWAQAVAIAGTVAGGYWTVSSLASTQGFAEGGYTNANLIMTHENGKREWVGKAAGSSAIVNDTQMSDIMEGAVAKGVYSALTANRELGGKGSTKNVYNFNVNGKKLLSVMEDEMHKQGKKLATV